MTTRQRVFFIIFSIAVLSGCVQTPPPNNTPMPTSTPMQTPKLTETVLPTVIQTEIINLTTNASTKISLLNYSLNYSTLNNEDICIPYYDASPTDPGIVIKGTLKNEEDRDYWVILSASAYDTKDNLVGRSTDSGGPVCGYIDLYVESNKTENFELHLKYNNTISRIKIFGGISGYTYQ